MQYSSVLIKTRAIALSSISFLDFLWTVVLCVILFSQWTVLDISERSLILVMLATHSATAVILLILLIIHFRPWLDAARVMFLLTIQFGTAGAFVYYYSGFKCLNEVTDQEGVCTFVIASILIGSWIIPALLVIYSFGLAFLVRRHRAMISKSFIVVDQENVLVTREAGLAPKNPSPVALVSRGSDSSYDSDSFRHSWLTKFSLMVEELHDQARPIVGARLSKPPPISRF